MTPTDSTYTDKRGSTWTRIHANVWQREDGAQVYQRDLDRCWLVRHNKHRNLSGGWFHLGMHFDRIDDVLERAAYVLSVWQQIAHAV